MYSNQPPEWKSAYTTGRDRWLRLQAALQSPAQPYFPDMSGWRVSSDPIYSFHTVHQSECCEGGIMRQLDEVSGEEKLCSTTYHYLRQDIGRFYYSNWYSPSAGAILADANLGRKDAESAPLRWADVIHLYWALHCQAASKSVSALDYILALNILNEPTREVVATIVTRERRYEGGFWAYSFKEDLYPTDPDFYTVLGTVIGGSRIALLTKYAGSFATWDSAPPHTIRKMKTIRYIKVVATGMSSLDLAFVLEDIHPPSGSQPLPWDPTKALPTGIALPPQTWTVK